MKNDKRLTLKIDAKTLAQLQQLAEQNYMTMSAFVRSLIRLAHEKIKP